VKLRRIDSISIDQTYYTDEGYLVDHKSIGDLETQLEFLCKELSENYKAVFSVLKSASSVKAASDIVLTQYERPADQSDSVKEKRTGYIRHWLCCTRFPQPFPL
jgi:hypothetical protein